MEKRDDYGEPGMEGIRLHFSSPSSSFWEDIHLWELSLLASGKKIKKMGDGLCGGKGMRQKMETKMLKKSNIHIMLSCAKLSLV